VRDIALRDVVVLMICVALIAGGAFFFFNRQSSNQESVSLEPIQAVPMRVPNASDSTPQPPAPVKVPARLEPRAATPTTPASASDAASSAVSSSDTTASDTSISETSTSDTTPSEITVPEPSERPSDATAPSDATLPSLSSDPTSDSSTAGAIITAATPSALPVRNSAQGWAVQAGAFKNASNATALRDRLLKLGLAARVEIGTDGVNRVLVGAYSSGEAAKAASASVAAALK
jgi:cell division protein FtsN